jgi:hypothetical protein
MGARTVKNRIRTTGTTLAVLAIDEGKSVRCLSREVFVSVLNRICPGFVFGPADIDRNYTLLLQATGEHQQEQERPDAEPIVRRLKSLKSSLQQTAMILRAHDTGWQTASDLNCARFVHQVLIGHPEIHAAASRVTETGPSHVVAGQSSALADAANRKMSIWGEICEQIAHTFDDAATMLVTEGDNVAGRPRLSWYDTFVAMLIEIGRISRFGDDRDVKRRKKGELRWLLLAAEEFEKLMPTDMRSVSRAARNRRVRESEKSINATMEIIG